MSATFDIYVPGRSWLHRVDPRVKIAFVATTTILLLIWFNLPLFLLLLVMTHVTLVAAGVGWRRIGGIWRALMPFLVLIFLLWPVFARQGTPVLVDWGPLHITGHGILGGAATATRFAAISFAFIIWLATTDQRALVRSFVRLGLPYSLGMSLTIGLRFIPTFAALFQSVSEAQQSRGLVLEGRGIGRARAMIPILVASLVTALRMSEQLSWTLEARAFGAPVKRTTLHDLSMRAFDWLLLGALVAIFAALLGLTFWLGFGRHLLSIL
ncbi:MAG: energy-coupling factor transporter transmembrane component T [Nitrolancea sp.]